MSTNKFIRNLYATCKMHGSGEAQVVLSDHELFALVSIAVRDLEWSGDELKLEGLDLPKEEYFQISQAWFDDLVDDDITSDQVENALDACFVQDNDFALYIENFAALHRRRVKYRRILASQPIPNMDQIGPRVLLEFGACDDTLLANWMTWRKWIYDIDNRAAQETGYLFEPLLASSIGGEPVGARNSPVKRIDSDGKATNNGRQIDCLVPSSKKTYELKLRVTIAASGQGRFAEELSFPTESQAAGFIPVLLVLDPTPSSKLSELKRKYLGCGGEVYIGDEAWAHMEREAGAVVSVFVAKYIKPTIKAIENVRITEPQALTLSWSSKSISISSAKHSYDMQRQGD